jgi:putative membrane protein
MKLKVPSILRLGFGVLAIAFAFGAAFGQSEPETSGEDVSGHPTTDSPYLRAKSKPSSSQQQQQQQATKLSQKDQKFLSQIAAGGVQVVRDSETAEKEGGAALKSVASRIASERSRSNKELLELAKKKGIGLGVDKIKARNIGKSNFDKQFVHTVGRDLQEDVRLLQAAASSSDDKDVKAWASKTLPMVKQHLNALQQVKG